MYTMKIQCANCRYVENKMVVDTKKYSEFHLYINATPCIKCGFLQKVAVLEEQRQAEGSISPAKEGE